MKHALLTPTICSAVLVAHAGAQPHASDDLSIGPVVIRGGEVDPIHPPRGELIASLPYDGTSLYGARGQDFESNFDAYDVFIIEDIEPTLDSSLGEFRSRGFGNDNPFAAEDVVVRIFENNGTGLPGEDGYTGELVMTTIAGAGFWSGEDWITNFGGQCLEAGPYYIVFHARLEFTCCGASWFFHQAGDPTTGGGKPNNAWHWVPNEGFGLGTHFPIDEPPENDPIGVNYLLFGDEANCGCENPDCAADLDQDGDADSDDFFLYLDLFETGDECADLDLDGDLDADDFFAYLDRFAAGC